MTYLPIDMNPAHLIPTGEPIPAPAWLFVLLEHALFLLHIILINIVVGGSMFALFSRFRADGANLDWAGVLPKKLPLILPFAINLGIAPLLFMQVVYGHLFYSSSVLMGSYWIAIIPLLVVAYYGIYIYSRRFPLNPTLARLSLGVATLIFLYIGFMLVNNLSLMVLPEQWQGYFERRGGTMLNLQDPTLAPRYLHFLLASLAMGGLFVAALNDWQGRKGNQNCSAGVKAGLRVFAVSTLLQLVIGSWYLLAIPGEMARRFMGRDMTATLVLALGVLAGVGAMASAFRGKVRPTLIQTLISLVAMIITRAELRSFYLEPHFQPASLLIQPQYELLALFLVVLLIGLGAVGYMIRLAFARSEQGGAQ